MLVKGIIDEDFINYKKPSMYIASSKCSFKCDKECGRAVCQNFDFDAAMGAIALCTIKFGHFYVCACTTLSVLTLCTIAEVLGLCFIHNAIDQDFDFDAAVCAIAMITVKPGWLHGGYCGYILY